jgi:superfamily I DNA/RNA helicase
MQLSNEQLAVLDSTGNICINAVAGSGKTTTLLAYAASRPKKSSILYLGFNKSTKLQAIEKFRAAGLNNVRVETAHSLAFSFIVKDSTYKVRQQDFTAQDLLTILQIQETIPEYQQASIIAAHVNKFAAYFCNSNASKVQDLNYLEVIADAAAMHFVQSQYATIELFTRTLLAMMHQGQIEITHDFYLKLFQLSNPTLAYDYILFDEGQDASPAMLDVFLKQSAIKVIAGDTHQQIYSWRYAVNSLAQVPFETYHLTHSYRFGKEVAALAQEILQSKQHVQQPVNVVIEGKGYHTEIQQKAIIARTNQGLLIKAIEQMEVLSANSKIYFEGNLNSYTFSNDGASLYDVLNLYNGKHALVRDPLIQSMKNLKALEDFIEKTGDNTLQMLIEVVRKYGNELPDLLRKLKERHVTDELKHQAAIVFTTVHRAKGLEYDTIQLAGDFMNDEAIERAAHELGHNPASLTRLAEEVNLLYVAATRTRNRLFIPERLIPKGFTVSGSVFMLREQPQKTNAYVHPKSAAALKTKPPANKTKQPTAITPTAVRTQVIPIQAWNDETDKRLTELFCKGLDLEELALAFGRTKTAVLTRVRKLGLQEKYGI